MEFMGDCPEVAKLMRESRSREHPDLPKEALYLVPWLHFPHMQNICIVASHIEVDMTF